MIDPDEFANEVMKVLRMRLTIQVSVDCRGDSIAVTTRLIDEDTQSLISRDESRDRVTIYQSDILS